MLKHMYEIQVQYFPHDLSGSILFDTAVVPTKSDSDVILCLQLLGKILTCTLHLGERESRDHLCINPILNR